MSWRTKATRAIWIFDLCCVLAHGNSEAQLKPIRRVLILNEASTSYPGINLLDQGIRSGLENSTYQLEIYREYMDAVLFPDPADQQRFREFYIRKYENRRPDVIITVGPTPLNFVRETHQKAFPDVPVVFCVPRSILPGSPDVDADFTGVENDLDPAATLDAALRLKPETKHVVVLGGTSPIGRQTEIEVKRRLRGYEGHLDFSYLANLDMPALLERLKRLPTGTVILLMGISQDGAGTRFIPSESASMVTAVANAPVFSLADSQLNHGEVGGKVANLAEEGKVAGGVALRILKGEKPQDITVMKGITTYMFDWRALKRWGLKESDLPPGSIVFNRDPTVWESYKTYIIGGISLLLAQALLIFGLVWQRARAKHAETQLRESEERFRLVTNTAPVMIWTAGTDRKCSYVNKTWRDFTGRAFQAELGDGWTEGVHPDDLGRCLQTYIEAFDHRESFEMQYRLRRHDGEYRWILDKGVPRFNPDSTFAGYIGSCIDITERKLAEEAMSTIGRRLIEAHEEERTWIGRELHDDINQRLALLGVELDRWHQHVPSTPGLSEQVHHAQERISQIAKDVQGLSHRLHSSKLEYLGLATAANSFCKEFSEHSKVEVQFSHTGIPRTLPKEVSLCLFRVLQEALKNAAKHSGVRSFAVDLHGTVSVIELTVADIGSGFEEQEAFTRHGLGLISMRERLQLVQGELSVKSKPGAGTTIRARVPLNTAEYRVMAG
jgi:PAS domain S-box-containing protein